jgi:hypothetical protein
MSKKLTEKLFCNERTGEYKIAKRLSRSTVEDLNVYKISSMA